MFYLHCPHDATFLKIVLLGRVTKAQWTCSRRLPIADVQQRIGSLLIVDVAQRTRAQINRSIRMPHKAQRTRTNRIAGLLQRSRRLTILVACKTLVRAAVSAEIQMRQEWHICITVDWIVKERVERIVLVVVLHHQILLENASVHDVREVGDAV